SEAYIGTPHKQARRLTPLGRKRTVSGWKLFNFLQFLAAAALAGLLTDRVAVAVRSAGALILAGGLEGPLLAVYHDHGLRFLDLRHLPLHQRFAAGAFPFLPGNCLARTPFPAAADINLVTHLECNLPAFDRGYRHSGHAQGNQRQQRHKPFFHLPPPFTDIFASICGSRAMSITLS